MNSSVTKKRIACGLGILLGLALILITAYGLRLYPNEIRRQLGYTPYEYHRLTGMVQSDITLLEPEGNFQMPLWEDHAPYRALLADNRTVYIVFNGDDGVSCILDEEYGLLFGMLEQGRA